MRTTLKRGSTNGTTDGAPVLPPGPLTHVTRYGPPRRSPFRLVGKIVAWLVAAVLVVAGGLAGGVWLWWEHSLAATAPSTPAERLAQQALDAPLPNQPAVAIVIGYDRRMGPERVLETRSDTIMLIRADPRFRTISMLSLPRDLLVEIAGCKASAPRLAKINEAFTSCGPRGTIQTVRGLTGIPINYFVTVDMRGFIKIVNQLGGVYMDVDRRYFNDNEGLGPGQTYSAIDLRPGYQRLNGGDALAYVRYRHTDNDFYRNARQQEFVKAIKHQLSGFSAVQELPGIVNVIKSNVTIGAGGSKPLDIETVIRYAKLAYELPSGNLFQVRIAPETLTQNSFFALSAPESEIERAVDAFMNPDPEAPVKAATVATGGRPRSRSQGPPASRVTVEVRNGNGVANSADDAAYLLQQRGYKAVSGGNADTFEYFETQVLYDRGVQGAAAAARDMVKLFGDAEAVEAPPGAELATMLRVVVGKTFQGTLAPVPRDTTPVHTPPRVVTDPASLAPLIRRQQRRAGFPLLVPTVRESSSSLSTLEGVRLYRLTPEHKGLRIVYNGPFGTDYWGIQQTSWTDAPILEGPTLVRRMGGREYRLYFNGPHLHMVAFEENGAAYWVVNTLLNALSNETMLAIAKGLKPLKA
jgi:LCP family protein required for cell wall assembly